MRTKNNIYQTTQIFNFPYFFNMLIKLVTKIFLMLYKYILHGYNIIIPCNQWPDIRLYLRHVPQFKGW